MVMFDAGDPREPEDFPNAALARARAIGADLAIYVEGPGGPTDGVWNPGEMDRVRHAGSKVAIPPGLSWNQFLQRWKAGKWKEYTFKQLETFRSQGFGAAEIDNLDQVFGDDADASKLVEFLKEYGALVLAERAPRLILKNISERRLARVAALIAAATLSREVLSDFHIAEDGSGAPSAQTREAARIGIQTLFSHESGRYRAFGRHSSDVILADI